MPTHGANGPLLVAGHTGLAGGAILRACERHGDLGGALGRVDGVLGVSSAQVDLRDPRATHRFLSDVRPAAIVLAAARVGGIAANAAEPYDFLTDNLRIQLSIMDAAVRLRVPRLLFLGSSCIYPRDAAQPITEDALLTGALERTNDAYAVAKIAGITAVQAARRQHGLRWISAMPTNLYGPGDNFHPERAHVLPALLRRCHEAARAGEATLPVWGTGRPRREFLHADDLGEACVHLLRHYDDERPINVGTGTDLPIAELARLIAEVVGYRGTITFDESRPDGTPRKVLDVSRITALGWRPSIGLRAGIERTYAWFTGQLACAGVRA